MIESVSATIAVGWEHSEPARCDNPNHEPFMSFRIGCIAEIAIAVPMPLADKLQPDTLKVKLTEAMRTVLDDWKADIV